MTDDPNRKSLRQFQCRDYLWETFEQMSQELECSPDYLINEAMRHYAQSREAPADDGAHQPGPPDGGAATARVHGGANAGRAASDAQRDHAPPAGPARRWPTTGGPRRMPPQPGAGYPQQPQQRPMPPMQQGGGQRQGYPPQRPAPPPQAPPQPPAYPQSNGIPVLYAVFEGQKYPIVKDEFYMGAADQSCDLIVKDPNVSRQHAPASCATRASTGWSTWGAPTGSS